MYFEHWRNLAWTTFLGNFPIHLVQQFCVTFMNSCLLEYAIGFEPKISFNWLFSLFTFISLRHFTFSNEIAFSQPLYQSLVSPRHYFIYLLSWEVCTNLQIKRFPLMKLWYTIWMCGGSEFQNNSIKKHPPHIDSLWNCLSRNLLIMRVIIMTLL